MVWGYNTDKAWGDKSQQEKKIEHKAKFDMICMGEIYLAKDFLSQKGALLCTALMTKALFLLISHWSNIMLLPLVGGELVRGLRTRGRSIGTGTGRRSRRAAVRNRGPLGGIHAPPTRAWRVGLRVRTRGGKVPRVVRRMVWNPWFFEAWLELVMRGFGCMKIDVLIDGS